MLKELLHGKVEVKKPIVNEGLLDFVGQEGSHCILKENGVLQFEEYVELMGAVFRVYL